MIHIRFRFVFCLSVSFSVALSAVFSSNLCAKDQNVYSLSLVLKDSFSPVQSPLWTQKEKREFEGLTRDFMAYRRSEMPIRQRLDYIAQCLASMSENPFCAYIQKRESEGQVASAQAAKKAAIEAENAEQSPDQSKAQLVLDLKQGRFEKFRSFTESKMLKLLREFKTKEEFLPVGTAAKAQAGCISVGFYTALGLETEEYFPEDSFRELALSFYEKAIQCASSVVSPAKQNAGLETDKAKFRLALLNIWSEKYSDAEKWLSDLTETNANDYLIRALYWRSFVAKKQGNSTLSATLRHRLLSDYPLQYHTLISVLESVNEKQKGKGKKSDSVLTTLNHSGRIAELLSYMDGVTKKSIDEIKVRSQFRPDLNERMKAIEFLDQWDAKEVQLKLLQSMATDLDTAEPDFKLYVAVWFKRVGDTINRFQLLSSLFKEFPSMLSSQTLDLFFPSEHVKILESASKKLKNKFEPLFALALMRQESAFQVRAQSSVGALGLMQIMPYTARRYERVRKSDLLDPKTNIRIGTRLISDLLTRFDFNAEKVLAAYNAGEEKVENWERRYPVSDPLLFADLMPYKETREYVASIGRNYLWYMALLKRGQLEIELTAGLSSESPHRTIAAKRPPKSGGKPSLRISISSAERYR